MMGKRKGLKCGSKTKQNKNVNFGCTERFTAAFLIATLCKPKDAKVNGQRFATNGIRFAGFSSQAV